VRPNLENRAGGVAQGVGPEFKPEYHHKKKIKKQRAGKHAADHIMI
jgi:hypothetical protein